MPDAFGGGAADELDGAVDLAELLAGAHQGGRIGSFLRQLAGDGPGVRGAIVLAAAQAVEHGLADQAVQAVGAVLDRDEEGAVLGERQRARGARGRGRASSRRRRGDRIEHREHLEPALLGGAQASEDFALDVGTEHRAAATAELARGAAEQDPGDPALGLFVVGRRRRRGARAGPGSRPG